MTKSVRSNSMQSIYGWDDKGKDAVAAADDILDFHSSKFNRTKDADDLSKEKDASATFEGSAEASGDDDDGEDARAPEGVEGQ